jgi:hypothetical protein
MEKHMQIVERQLSERELSISLENNNNAQFLHNLFSQVKLST